MVDVRPRRTLSRRDSERESRLNPQVFKDRWETGPFADVPQKRSFGIGLKVWTSAHEQLIGRMRLEGARLAQELAESRRQVTLLDKRYNETMDKLSASKAEVRTMQRYSDSLLTELKQTQQILTELDEVYMANRHLASQRNSYIFPAAEKDTDQPQGS